MRTVFGRWLQRRLLVAGGRDLNSAHNLIELDHVPVSSSFSSIHLFRHFLVHRKMKVLFPAYAKRSLDETTTIRTPRVFCPFFVFSLPFFAIFIGRAREGVSSQRPPSSSLFSSSFLVFSHFFFSSLGLSTKQRLYREGPGGRCFSEEKQLFFLFFFLRHFLFLPPFFWPPLSSVPLFSSGNSSFSSSFSRREGETGESELLSLPLLPPTRGPPSPLFADADAAQQVFTSLPALPSPLPVPRVLGKGGEGRKEKNKGS